MHGSTVGACVEVGKFGIEEEVEILKRDKNVLMQELVRLRQKQQVTDNQLQNVGQRVQSMEQRQQQMMSFLAKAMHSPGFLAQFVQQQNDSNRHMTGGNKKRRLHRQEDSLATKDLHNSVDGHVVKYQSSLNDAAKALFRQILQINNSATESSIQNPDVFLIDDVPSAIASDSSSSSTQVSNVNLSMVPPMSELTSTEVGSQSQFPLNCMTSTMSEVQSSPAGLSFCRSQGTETENSLVNHDLKVMGADTRNMEEIDMMSTVLDGSHNVEPDYFSPDADGISKLPGINDEFWELFFRPSPLTEDTEETKYSSLVCGLTEDQGFPSENEKQENFDKIQHVDHLTQQMGLLASKS